MTKEILYTNKGIPPYIDSLRFEAACQYVLHATSSQNGIGTLGEKTIHAVLKHYYSPDCQYHEIKTGSYVADIKINSSIYEIQTRGFHTMRKKLDFFLQDYDVTIIYPIVHTKWLSWLDTETGELSPKRKSPKKGACYQIFPELYAIKMFLRNPHLHFILSLIDVEETRYLNGWSHDKKKGSSRMDGKPVNFYDELHIKTLEDYQLLLPPSLPERFTSKDLMKCAHITQKTAGCGISILTEVGAIEQVGKLGRAYLYQTKQHL